MGFNKCIINKEKLFERFNESNSIESIIKYLNQYDSFICEDEWSDVFMSEYNKPIKSDVKLLNFFCLFKII